MTLYTVFVADKQLNEVDYTGIDYISVSELKKMYPISEQFPEQPWHSMDDDAQILHAPDEGAFAKLHVYEWGNPPYDLINYNDKPFIYGVDGNWNEEFVNDLLNYIKKQLSPDQIVQLLRFWADEIPRPILKKRTISIQEIELTQLHNIAQEQYIRVSFV
ncbi:hypothetical protein [Solibacillus daqui]|uniref:hypothetical protein n=1 Tax=Solibacillus daqui TaxID=2912187 RepID=UPI002366DEFA|nr:hypothetical protein [Solibacillus daqui]